MNLVHGLWIQNTLSDLELMTMNSFLQNGATFWLWSYERILTHLPKGAIVRDANEIISKKDVFRYPENMLLGFGSGSYAGFSDVFRYKVLYEYGGWWSDMDVTCLKPLSEIKDDYWFRFHGVLSLVGNIMKVPPKSELMKICYDRAKVEHTAHTQDWHKAIRILCYHVENLGLDKFIHYNACPVDRQDILRTWHQDPRELSEVPTEWRFIHWCNSVLNRSFSSESVFAKLRHKYCGVNPLFLMM